MKLLLDQNLSRHLVAALSLAYPGTQHVVELGLTTATDTEIWTLAQTEGYAILSKDADFVQLALLRQAPPKVIYLRVGNCATEQIEGLLHKHQVASQAFLASSESVLILAPSIVA